jgi:mono/diheme cytochrome c family protein
VSRALLPLLALLLPACSTSDVDPMEIQPKLRAYGESERFVDGRAMRTPPFGTVPRERIIGDSALTSGQVSGRWVERNPLPLTAALLAQGRRRYDITCAVCHGLLGDGRSIVGRNMSLRPPPSLHERVPQQMPGQIFATISSGYGMMPGYGAELPPDERWAVVAYLGALWRSQNTRIEDVPPSVRRDLKARP